MLALFLMHEFLPPKLCLSTINVAGHLPVENTVAEWVSGQSGQYGETVKSQKGKRKRKSKVHRASGEEIEGRREESSPQSLLNERTSTGFIEKLQLLDL